MQTSIDSSLLGVCRRYHEHWYRICVRLCDPCRGVQESWAVNDQTYRCTPCRPRVAVCHERCTLLVRCGEYVESRGLKSIEKVQVMDTRNPEHRVDAYFFVYEASEVVK